MNTELTQELLTQAEPDQLLAAFVERFNDLMTALEDRDTAITLLRQERDLRKERDLSRQRFNESCGVIQELKKELSKGLETGLWHQGDHHLVIWSQKVRMQREDGSTFESQPLLYMHQSGRGGMMHWDPESGMAHLCASPKGGLRPSDAALQAAGDWLYKVNVLQDGEVREEDRRPVNYNGEAA